MIILDDRLTILKWCRKAMMDRVSEKPKGGIKTLSGDKITYIAMIEDMNTLIKAETHNRLKVVRFCRDCVNWSGTRDSKRACCFPKAYDSFRNNKDYCTQFEKRPSRRQKNEG